MTKDSPWLNSRWLHWRNMFSGGLPPPLRKSLRKAVQLTRKGPGGLVRVGLCYFEILPEAETLELILSNYYEHEERNAIRRFLPPDAPVIEIGGSQGIVSCLTNRLLKDKKRHVVVEANSGVLPLLKRNRQRNRCGFEIIHAAVGAEGDKVRFYQNENPLKSSALVTGEEFYDVPCLSLSSLATPRGFTACTLVCDIEGAELGLIEAEGQVLRDRFRTLIIEFHPMINGPEAVRAGIARLESYGFTVVSIERHVYVFRKTPAIEPAGLSESRPVPTPKTTS